MRNDDFVQKLKNLKGILEASMEKEKKKVRIIQQKIEKYK